jgi:HTH-type transcriptional regulator/antitoxin HigA
MITNERQYLNTRAEAEKFERAIEEARQAGPRPRVDPRVHAAMLEGMKSELGELRRQVRRYERLRAGKVKTHKVSRISELPDALIEARIARNWTQKDLASQLGVAEQQVQRYENERYGRTSLDRLTRIADILGVRMAGEVKLPAAPAQRTTGASVKTKAGAAPRVRSAATASSGRAAPRTSKATANTAIKQTDSGRIKPKST